MTNSLENLIVGCKDWFHENWQASFYPEEIPEEWLLDFYSTQFLAVLVPQARWSGWSDDEIEAISEALEDEPFHFVFELDTITADQVNRLEFFKGVLNDLAYGVMVKGKNSEAFDLSDFAVTRVVEPNQVDVLSEWQLTIHDKVYFGAPIAQINLNDFDSTQLKQLLSDFMIALPEGQSGGILFVEGDDIQPEAVKNLQVMAELMGY